MQVTLKGIQLAYDRHNKILDQLSFHVQDGELLALLGPSGSGKSTILNLIAGLLTPNAGQILFDETDVTKLDARNRNIGMVFQDYALYPQLNVLYNIAFPLKMAHVKKATRQEQAQKLAKLVHIESLLTKFPSELSGGQQQRVAIARALAKKPKILLLDEPLSNLDAALRVELRDEIRHIQQVTGVTTIFVIHDQNDALRIADKIIVLANGVIQQVSTGADLYRHPRNLFVAQFIGSPKINTVPIADLIPYISRKIPESILAQAVTAAFRSESITNDPVANALMTNLPVTMTHQVQIGRDSQTQLQFENNRLISTAISEDYTQKIQTINVAPRGFFLFNDDGVCIWEGDAHD